MDSDEWNEDFDVLSDPEEQAHLYSVLDSFRQFRRVAHYNVTHTRRQNFYALPSEHCQLLSNPPISFLETLNKIDDAIDANADIAEAILDAAITSMGLTIDQPGNNLSSVQAPWHGKARNIDLDKARSTINQLYRDWSAEGDEERRACYGPVLRNLRRFYPQRNERSEAKVLVPGAGLGRLVYDICAEGFDAEGNEVSYHQLLTSSFVLNHTTKANEYALHPWVWSFSNIAKREDQLRKITIPDVHPGTYSQPGGRMNMTAGDFCSVYGDEDYRNSFDAVITVFFIDTAPNLITYIETIKSCLKRDGLWINLGPLLWHFDDKESKHKEEDMINSQRQPGNAGASVNEPDNGKIGDSGSVELSNDEVVSLVQSFGFNIIEEPECENETRYIGDKRSLLQNIYRPYHWIARNG